MWFVNTERSFLGVFNRFDLRCSPDGLGNRAESLDPLVLLVSLNKANELQKKGFKWSLPPPFPGRYEDLCWSVGKAFE